MDIFELYTLACTVFVGFGAALSKSEAQQYEDDLRVLPTDVIDDMDKPGVTVIDVRQQKGFDDSDTMIKEAVREDPNDVDSWAGKYSSSDTLFLYCS